MGEVQGTAHHLLFEGRDGAGKGGTIKAITERVSPVYSALWRFPPRRTARRVKYTCSAISPHFPAAGEIVIFDRSWYNRAGVEYVMGFCTKEQHRRFLELCPTFEGYLTSTGIILLKFWLEVSNEEQERRFEARIDGSAAPVEAQPDGLAFTQPLV